MSQRILTPRFQTASDKPLSAFCIISCTRTHARSVLIGPPRRFEDASKEKLHNNK